MLFFNEKNKSLNVFFIQEHHLLMLKELNLPLSDLPYLLYTSVDKVDLINWISYQRSMEKKYFGRKFTTYNTTGELKYAPSDIKFDMDIVGPVLDEVYKENKSYEESRFLSYYADNKTIVVLSKDNGMVDRGFTFVQKNPVSAIYQALLTLLGYHQLYFREPVKDKEESGIVLSELIDKMI